MSITLRVLLISGTVIVIASIARDIKRRRIRMQDSIFWVVVAALLGFFALCPSVVIRASRILGVETPANFVFLGTIAVLLMKLFSNSAEISQLKHRVDELSEEVGLTRAKERE